MSPDIAIVGLAVRGPGVRDQRDFWDVIVNGRSQSGPFPAHRAADVEKYLRLIRESGLTPDSTPVAFYDGYFMDRVDEFDHEFFGMPPKSAGLTDPQQRLLLQTTYEALEDAGYTGESRAAQQRVGVFVGHSATSGHTYLHFIRTVDWSAVQLGLLGNIQAMMANRLSHHLDLTGPSAVVDAACASGIVALHQARLSLLNGDCDLAVVAGARVVLVPEQHPAMRVGFESHDGVTRPFDDRADGTGMGEGSGAVVLKRLDRAVADGDQIYAVVKGTAVNHNGRTTHPTHPDAEAQARLIEAAWAAAEVDPIRVRYVEAHGTGTRAGDPVELDGLSRAFGRHTQERGFCALGAVKANIGHLLEAAGVVGLIKAALVLRRRVVPPVANLETPNPRLPLDRSPLYLPTSSTELTAEGGPVLAGVSAFGLGGTNAHAVLEEYQQHVTPSGPGVAHLFTLSARTEASLAALVRAWTDDLGSGRLDQMDVADICYTTNVSRSSHRYRLAFAVASVDELKRRLSTPTDRHDVAAPSVAHAELAALASSYVDGVDIGGRAVVAREQATNPLGEPLARRPRIVDLVPYQFDVRRCWIDVPEIVPRTPAAAAPIAHDVIFLPAPPPEPAGEPATFLVLADAAGDGAAFVSAVLPDAAVLTLADTAEPGDPSTRFRVDEEDLERVAHMVVDGGYTHVVHALAFDDGPANNLDELDQRLQKNLHSLFLLGKGLMMAGVECTLVVLTRKAVATTQGESGVVVENGSLVGLIRAIAVEYPYLRTRLVDVDGDTSPVAVRDELSATAPGVFAWRDGRRYQETLTEMERIAEPGAGDYLKPGGTYLITGGTGGIGLEVARAFAAASPGVRLVLVSRSELPPQRDWASIASSDDTKLGATVSILRECLDLGTTVELMRADTGDADAMATVVATIRRRFGRLDGIAHAAGVGTAERMMFRDVDAVDAVLRPKLRGAFIVDHLTRDDRPDFILHFGSVAAVTPAPGQADYAAANAYLDNAARANSDSACRVLTIDWCSWKETGMAHAFDAAKDGLYKALPTATAIDVLDQALRSDRTRLMAGEISYLDPMAARLLSSVVALSPNIADKVQAGRTAHEDVLTQAVDRVRGRIDAIQVELTGRSDGCFSDAEVIVAKCFTEATGYPTLDVRADFFELGGESITALAVADNLSTYYGVRIDPAALLVDRTIESIARRLVP